jgi:hypothetical protein
VSVVAVCQSICLDMHNIVVNTNEQTELAHYRMVWKDREPDFSNSPVFGFDLSYVITMAHQQPFEMVVSYVVFLFLRRLILLTVAPFRLKIVIFRTFLKSFRG